MVLIRNLFYYELLHIVFFFFVIIVPVHYHDDRTVIFIFLYCDDRSTSWIESIENFAEKKIIYITNFDKYNLFLNSVLNYGISNGKIILT